MSEKSIVIKWAAIAVIIYLVFGLLGHLLGFTSSGFLSFIFGLVIAFPILMASFEFRDRFNNSFASLGQIFKIGIKITFALMLIAAFWAFINPTFLNKNYLAEERIRNVEEMKEYGLTAAQIEENLEMTYAKISPVSLLVLDKVIKVLFFGIFVSLVSGLIIRNEKPMSTNETELEIEE